MTFVFVIIDGVSDRSREKSHGVTSDLIPIDCKDLPYIQSSVFHLQNVSIL